MMDMNCKKLQWKDVPRYKGYYQVSEKGDIKRLERHVRHPKKGLKIVRERILKPGINRGYDRVTLSKRNIKEYHLCHRLVALVFLSPDPKRPHVNHIDGNKANNHFSNLEWCTPKENERHKSRMLMSAKGTNNLINATLNPKGAVKVNGRVLFGLKHQKFMKRLLKGEKVKSDGTAAFYAMACRLNRKMNIPISKIKNGTSVRYHIKPENIIQLGNTNSVPTYEVRAAS